MLRHGSYGLAGAEGFVADAFCSLDADTEEGFDAESEDAARDLAHTVVADLLEKHRTVIADEVATHIAVGCGLTGAALRVSVALFARHGAVAVDGWPGTELRITGEVRVTHTGPARLAWHARGALMRRRFVRAQVAAPDHAPFALVVSRADMPDYNSDADGIHDTREQDVRAARGRACAAASADARPSPARS